MDVPKTMRLNNKNLISLNTLIRGPSKRSLLRKKYSTEIVVTETHVSKTGVARNVQVTRGRFLVGRYLDRSKYNGDGTLKNEVQLLDTDSENTSDKGEISVKREQTDSSGGIEPGSVREAE